MQSVAGRRLLALCLAQSPRSFKPVLLSVCHRLTHVARADVGSHTFPGAAREELDTFEEPRMFVFCPHADAGCRFVAVLRACCETHVGSMRTIGE